jgi:methylmalonyl-CoA mutase C-terminal domain/subunit
MIVEAAVQEDVGVIAMSTLSGNHHTVFPRVLELLAEVGAEHVLLVGGGIIPDEDARSLVDLGVSRIFGPGTDTRDVVEYIRSAGAGSASGQAKHD